MARVQEGTGVILRVLQGPFNFYPKRDGKLWNWLKQGSELFLHFESYSGDWGGWTKGNMGPV